MEIDKIESNCGHYSNQEIKDDSINKCVSEKIKEDSIFRIIKLLGFPFENKEYREMTQLVITPGVIVFSPIIIILYTTIIMSFLEPKPEKTPPSDHTPPS